MNRIGILFSICWITFASISIAQTSTLKGQITDEATGEPLITATILAGETGAITDFDGHFEMQLEAGTYLVSFSYVGYEKKTETVILSENETKTIEIGLAELATLLQTATVTSGKFEKPLGEVTVSLEVIKPQLVESTNSTSVDEVLQKVPGVDILDGQANIRGGSGFSYGAGSRVLLLLDDIPILTSDSGFPNWDDIPIENIEQIEVVKGAASALYGSSALNGIINIRTAYAKSKPITKFSTFYTSFLDPEDKEQVWWEKQPYALGVSASHRQKINKLDLVLGGYYLNRDSYNQDTYSRYGRFNVGTRYRVNEKLSVGFNGNFNRNNNGDFFYWAGIDSLYRSHKTAISISENRRFNIDPFLTYYDNKGNRHKVNARYYDVENNNSENQSNSSQLLYAEYQFQRKFQSLDVVTTAGIVSTDTWVQAELYGDTTFTSQNIATYLQAEKKFFDKLNISAGFRYEFNQVNAPESIVTPDSVAIVPNGEITESKPVFRLGANYQVAPFTYLRASWGQGYRFPTIAESFIKTTFGSSKISPNPALQSETGWSTEIGLKQGFRIGNFDGFLDLSGFWSEYDDMIEFAFRPDGYSFQSNNVGGTIIKGFEVGIAGRGNFFGLPTSIWTGYTYIDPKFEKFDTGRVNPSDPEIGTINAQNSSADYNVLKYRMKHTFKLDVETRIRDFSIGLSGQYNSHMEAVDAIFEVDFLFPGIRQFRAENDKGFKLFNARVAYQFLDEKLKVSAIANNILNEAYTLRPGLMEAPRNVTLRVDYSF